MGSAVPAETEDVPGPEAFMRTVDDVVTWLATDRKSDIGRQQAEDRLMLYGRNEHL